MWWPQFWMTPPPGTQEYIMLRQDSIQSAELKKKESPFRAKCHEIFCCPLKQVHHKENTEPEGLFKTDTCFACVLSLCSLSLPTLLSCFGLCIAVWCAVYCSVPVTAIGDPGSLVSVLCSVRWGHCRIQSSQHSVQHPASCSWNIFSWCHDTISFWLPKLLAPVTNTCPNLFPSPCIPEAAASWGMTLLKGNNEKIVSNFLSILHSIKLLHCFGRMLMVNLVRWRSPRLPM